MSAVDAAVAQRRQAHALIAKGDDFHARFHDWLITHHGIYEKFEAAANMVLAKGITNYSAFVIVNVLRWRADTQGTKFAMSNTMVPDMARLYNKANGVQFFKVSTRFSNKGNSNER